MVRDGERARTCATQLEAVQSGFGAATREGIEAELTRQDNVSVHWSERWCRHGTWTNCGIEISSCLGE